MTKNRPVMTMLVGLPGCGKSTWVKNNKQDGDIVLSTDNFILEYAESMKSTYNNVFQYCIKDAETNLKNELQFALANNFDIIWDQTNVSKKSRKKKLAKIPKHYIKRAIVFIQDNKVIYERNEERKKEGRNLGRNKLEEIKNLFVIPQINTEDFDMILIYDESRKVYYTMIRD